MTVVNVCVSSVWPAVNTAGLIYLAWIQRRHARNVVYKDQ